MTTNEERMTFAAVIAREIPGLAVHHVVDFAKRLMRWGGAYGRLQEWRCNGVENADEPRVDRKESNLEARISAVCKAHGIGVVFQGDPRGRTVKLVLPSGLTNDLGRDGYCVPNS